MAFSLNNGRQNTLVASAAIAFDDAATAIVTPVVKLPYNSVVTGGFIIVDTAWDSGTSDAFALGDTSVTNRHLSAVDLQSTGVTALTITGYVNTGGLDLDAIQTKAGAAAAAGAARIYVEYIITDRATEVQTT